MYLQVPWLEKMPVYNPSTGDEDLKLRLDLDDAELNRMRGFGRLGIDR